MAFRMGGGGNNRRNDYNNRNFDRGFGNNGGMNRPHPWGGDNSGGNNYRQGSGGGGGGGGGNNGSGGMNNDVLSLANSLVNNLLRNQNHPPSLLDLPNRGGYGGGRDSYNNYNQMNRGGNRNVGGPPNRRNGPPGARNNNKLGAIKGGIRKPNPVDRAKKVLAKNASKDPKDVASAADAINKSNVSTGSKKDKKESKYADVPNVMFYCHMCKKHMWDATSFENHVKGRTHLMMRDGVEESYRLKANMIRQEAKIEEQLKAIELERLKRMGKGGKGTTRREYCTMCDLHFYGHLSAHRKTDGHLQLKKFLHPKCTECGQEFATRIDFDNHLLTPTHMKKAHASKSNKPEKRKNALHIYTAEDELKDLKEEKEEKRSDEKKDGEDAMETDETATVAANANGDKPEGEAADEDITEKEETAEGETKTEEEKALVEPVPEPDDVILDFADGDEVPVEVETKIPKYNCQRQIGSSLLHKLDCVECHLCGRFFDNEVTAEIHSRTLTHHRNFVKFLAEKANDTKIAQKRASAALEEIERKKKKVEAAAAAAEEQKTVEEGSVVIKSEGDESYDPTEATTEDDSLLKDADETMDAQDAGETEDVSAVNVKQEDEDALLADDIETVPEPVPVPAVKPAVATPAKPAAPVKAATPVKVATPVKITTPVKVAASPANVTVTPARPAVKVAEEVPASPVVPKAVEAVKVGTTPKATPTRGRGRGRGARRY